MWQGICLQSLAGSPLAQVAVILFAGVAAPHGCAPNISTAQLGCDTSILVIWVMQLKECAVLQ